MDSNAQYYPFDSFQPPIADSLIRDGECKNGHESCLFRIIELYHGRFTLRKLSRWKQWECRPGDTDDWYVSIIICPFRFEPHSLKQCPSLPALFIHKNIFHPVFHRCISPIKTVHTAAAWLVDSNTWMKCVHLSNLRCSLQFYRITQRVKMKRVGDLLNSN